MSSNNFGIGLLFESQKNNIKNDADILAILVHWILIKNNFRSVGVGDSKHYNEEDKLSELLPDEWNINETYYTLRYALNKKIYILHGILLDGTLLFNILDATTLEATNLTFDISKVVKSKTGETLEDFINDSQNVIDRLDHDLIKPLLKKKEEKPETTNDPLRVLPEPRSAPRYSQEDNHRRIDPLWDIGRGDLDPFGRGGGMIFSPPNFQGGIGPMRPPGHPPGARFDPINPLNPQRRGDPDPDHFRPPGYDDMFM